MASSDIDVEGETDRLYQLPLAEFIAARNTLAARLKSGGDKDGAAHVRALIRPTISAWAANQAYWMARDPFDAFVSSTWRLQRAQAKGVTGTELRDAMRERREAQGALVERARSLLVAAGHGASQDALRRVSDTLEALAFEARRPDGDRVHPGRLTGDLEPPGFEAITALGPGLAPPAAEPASERGSALERAREALAQAEGSLERATREEREAVSARSLAEGRAQAARVEVAEITRRLEEARNRASLAADAAAAAGNEADRLAAARGAAEAVRDAAFRSVRDLE